MFKVRAPSEKTRLKLWLWALFVATVALLASYIYWVCLLQHLLDGNRRHYQRGIQYQLSYMKSLNERKSEYRWVRIDKAKEQPASASAKPQKGK
jgi:hypothetical protein